ncbi:hypothetical protein W911_01265 [Hyphomicrobium nitrativorans NL23]|uniref:Mucin n=1 Tax=Hyphomicrobium nitrativorans NL23 TaxID=1029756 RepID=V5SH62_9HYPH|nr:hypothetical protein [Hyphomicrobium nitrativorans]AHB49822.1 hypothetical protein W911_01265 [Hyphomicrobium nitrativorans NL23]
MKRMISAVAAGTLLAVSPALAGGSMEQPTDKKAPMTNATGTDNPANAGEGAAKPAGEGAPLPEGAAEGTSSGAAGVDAADTDNSDASEDTSK